MVVILELCSSAVSGTSVYIYDKFGFNESEHLLNLKMEFNSNLGVLDQDIDFRFLSGILITLCSPHLSKT